MMRDAEKPYPGPADVYSLAKVCYVNQLKSQHLGGAHNLTNKGSNTCNYVVNL